MQILKTDILILGTGLAGLSLAKYTNEINPKNKITLLTKTSIDKCNTFYAQGGIAVVRDFIKDSYEKHIEDTLKAGKGFCDVDVVNSVVKQAPDRLKELLSWGIELDKNQSGELDLGLEGGHSQNRIVHYKDKTGYEIETKLVPLIKNLPNTSIKTSFFATDLLIKNNTCIGVVGFDDKNEPTTIYTKAVVLATGGSGQVFGVTSNPFVSTGDGVAMAFRAGAKLVNMKYIQFHPTALYEPNKSQAFLITEAIRGFGAHILNNKMERFVSQYHPDGELATRDVVSKAISDQMKKEHSNHVWLDVRHLPIQTFKMKFPKVYNYCLENGINISKDLIPIAPAAHYQCGGIDVDSNGKTSVKQLFAIGECSHTGLHGANRLASNSLLEAMVYSHSLANYLTNNILKTRIKTTNNIKIVNKYIRHEDILEFRNLIQKFMTYDTIFRATENLESKYQSIIEIENRFLKKFKDYNFHPYLCETYNLIQTALIILKDKMNETTTKK